MLYKVLNIFSNSDFRNLILYGGHQDKAVTIFLFLKMTFHPEAFIEEKVYSVKLYQLIMPTVLTSNHINTLFNEKNYELISINQII